MDSKILLDFEKAIQYMDPMQVTDYLHKTLDFLKRNNNELYFPSISSYVEAFLVNLVSDTRNLMSASFKNENRKLASEIIEILEMARDVFRWTHSYENGNLLVYKKIFSNTMKKPKPSSIAHRLLQAQAQSTSQSPTTLALESMDDLPDIPATSTSFKLRFLSKTLRFIKDENEFTLYYKEMPLDLAEYIYSLIKYRDKDVGFGYKSLYAPLWEAMEEYGVDYKFEVMLEETSRDTAVLKLEKVPKHNKSKRDKTKREIPEMMNNVNGQEEMSKNKSPRSKKHKRNPTMDQFLNVTSPAFANLELLSNINERFFADVVVALTEFADDQSRASIVFQQLSEEEIAFVKRVKTLAESSKVREMFPPKYRDLLWTLDCSIKEVLQTCKITTTVNEEDRSITLKKTPRFPAPQPVTQQRIQFQKGGKLPATGDEPMTIDEPNTTNNETIDNQPQERGRSKRTAKLLEDLSTPVESDRGIRMMLLMGWSGGALGARGDGIVEPVMPNIDQPTRGGLGHVPPPKPQKANPRRALHFRLTFLHSMYDLLLHGDMRKEIQFNEPLVGKETNFVQSALSCLNKRRCLSLTEQDNELIRLLVRELTAKPGVKVRHEFSRDFKTVILHKLITNEPVTNVKMPKPKPAEQPQVVTITDDDVDVLITTDDVCGVIPHVDLGLAKVASNHKAAKRRAARLLVLTKIAEVLHWDCQSRVIFKFTFSLPNKLNLFISSVIDSLNNDVRHRDLFGWEWQVYEDIREMVPGSMMSWEAMSDSKFILRKTPLISEEILPNAGPYLPINNNDNKTDDRNQIINVTDWTEHIDNQSINVFENNFGSKLSIEDEISNIADDISDIELNSELLQAIVNTGNLNDIKNIDVFIKNDPLTFNTNERNVANTSVQGRDELTPGGISVTIKNNTTKYITVKNVNQINAEIDSFNSIENEKTDDAEVEFFECDVEEPEIFEIAEENVTEFDIQEPSERIEIPELNVTELDIEKTSERIEIAELNVTECDIEKPSERIEIAELNVTECDIEKPCKRIEIAELNVTAFDIEKPSERIEIAEVKTTEFDNVESSVKETDVSIINEGSNNKVTEEAKIIVCGNDKTELSDWDRDIDDLEMTILNVGSDYVVKEENTECHLETAFFETDLEIIKNEKDESLNSKRSHSSSVCSQELEPKKVKISCETDEHVVRITPKNPDEEMTQELVKQVQTLMSNELDKSGAFLALLKCHGVQNGGLIYSCHDEEDVAWLKKVISVANLDVEIVPCDLCSEMKTRELLIRINSYIPVNAKKIFRKFEIYNLGLDTKYWRVIHKHTDPTFVMFIVTVDEKSFKYICDEKFSLYCGIDKARCSITD